MDIHNAQFSKLSSCIKSSVYDVGNISGKKKQNKRKKSENGDKLSELEPSPRKKQKKEVVVDSEKYKPGMLSDILQKQKYGCLILPWEASFGKNLPHQSGLTSLENSAEQKRKVKINPLFDIIKKNEGNMSGKNCSTFTIFVGNLPQEVTGNRVKKIFKKFCNTISKIKIKSDDRKNYKSDRTNQSVEVTNHYKHAIVKFNSLESFNAALKMNGKLFHGRHLRITGAESNTASDSEKGVFIGNLAAGVSDDVLWKTFENCGAIDSVRVIRDRLNKKGIFGYINFQDTESVEEALKLDGTSVLDRDIRVRRINKNIGSLSNSITVKRNKKKQTKPLLNSNDKTVVCSEISNLAYKKKKKSHELTKRQKQDLGQTIEPEIPLKKKKKNTTYKKEDMKSCEAE